MGELRTATDLALRGTKVAALAVGLAMSTLVVQECHLWLNLADKVWFLDSPIPQVGLFGDAVESFAQQFSAAQKQTEAIRHILPRRPAAASTRSSEADPLPARRRGRPSAAASTPAGPPQQPPPSQQLGAFEDPVIRLLTHPLPPSGVREVSDIQVILETRDLKEKRVTLDIEDSLDNKAHLDFWGIEESEE
ncbi:unnamed protein product [Leuciscus chuanchicus]